MSRAADEFRHAIYGVWANGALAYVNPGWERMARANGGAQVMLDWPLGRSIWEAVPSVLEPFYRELWGRALATGAAQEHDYECSSPTEHRIYRMRVEPLQGVGLLVRNDLQIAHPAEPLCGAELDDYRAPSGLVAMCANCRCTRRTAAPDLWDWVPSLVAHPPARITHGICGMCLELYYPERSAGR